MKKRTVLATNDTIIEKKNTCNTKIKKNEIVKKL